MFGNSSGGTGGATRALSLCMFIIDTTAVGGMKFVRRGYYVGFGPVFACPSSSNFAQSHVVLTALNVGRKPHMSGFE